MVYMCHGLNSWQLHFFGHNPTLSSRSFDDPTLNSNSLYIISLSQDALVVCQSFVHQISLQLEAKSYSYISYDHKYTYTHIYCNTNNRPTTIHILYIHSTPTGHFTMSHPPKKNSYLSFPHRIMLAHHWRNTSSHVGRTPKGVMLKRHPPVMGKSLTPRKLTAGT